MDETRQMFKVVSLLLQYPEPDLIDALPELEQIISNWSRSEVKDKCGRFLAYLHAAPLAELQVEYTARIDFDPSTCMHLTFHECGESRERGKALVRFKELYRSAGYDLSTSELPDFLPVVLEFLAVCPDEACTELLARYGAHITTLAARLKDRSSPYSHPLEALNLLISECAQRGD
jgi:nitrate reductase delta subunit